MSANSHRTLVSNAFDYNDFIKQVRGFVQGHPQVRKLDYLVAGGGIKYTGTGTGELYVSTEFYTPAGGTAGSPTTGGTKYLLTCTLGGGAGVAKFDVKQMFDRSPQLLGVLKAGSRWAPEGDKRQINSPEVSSPKSTTTPIHSPEHGLRLILRTITNWVAGDTISFRLIDHDLDNTASHNWRQKKFFQNLEDANGDFVTEWYAQAPTIARAGLSPEAAVYYGMQSTFSFASDYYNVGIMGADGFVAGSAFASQPNTSGVRYTMLDDTQFPFWLTADADGLYAVCKIGSVYQHLTMQLLDMYATGTQHPKPMYIGGMTSVAALKASESNNDQNAAPWNPGSSSTTRFRWTDGTWYSVQNRQASYSTNATNLVPTRWIWPYKDGTGTVGSLVGAGYTWNWFVKMIERKYDLSYELIPMILFINNPQNATVGELKYIRFVSQIGLNAEDTTTDTTVSPNQLYIAMQNANLSGREDFCVMELNP